MNSFNTVANSTPSAGKSREERTPEDEWPEYLSSYSDIHHCLANFWLLSMEIGRTFKGPLNKAISPVRDYMDNFLKMVRLNVNFNTSEIHYYRCFDNWDGFVKKHFIGRAYLNNGKIDRYSDSCSEIVIEKALNKIEKRAEEIAESEYAEELVGFFKTIKMYEHPQHFYQLLNIHIWRAYLFSIAN